MIIMICVYMQYVCVYTASVVTVTYALLDTTIHPIVGVAPVPSRPFVKPLSSRRMDDATGFRELHVESKAET